MCAVMASDCARGTLEHGAIVLLLPYGLDGVGRDTVPSVHAASRSGGGAQASGGRHCDSSSVMCHVTPDAHMHMMGVNIVTGSSSSSSGTATANKKIPRVHQDAVEHKLAGWREGGTSQHLISVVALGK